MHSIKVSVRLIAFFAVAISAVLAFASLSPSQPRQVEAGAQPVIQAGISCNDVWLDRPPVITLGQPHDPDDVLIGKSMTRIEPSQTGGPKDFDLTTVSYLGPDLKANAEPEDAPFPDPAIGDLVADKPPTLLPCQDKVTNGEAGPEANQMNPNTPFNMISNHRPSTVGTLVADGPDWNLVSISCAFSEANKQWVRTETTTRIVNVGPGAKNFGIGTLYLGTKPPATGLDVDGDTKIDVAVDAADAATCTNLTIGIGPGFTFPFPFVLESHARTATTDHPEQAKNAGIAIDPDGAVVDGCAAHVIVTNEKEKDEAECQDGSAGGEAPNFVADDWDGDGCPDWDELDKDFINGRDPFNPNDCGVNFTGAYSALVTVTAAQDGTPGSYFHAIVALVHQKADGFVKTKYTLLDPILIGALDPVIVDVAVDPKGTPNKNFVAGDFIRFQGQDEVFVVNAVQKGDPVPAGVHRLTLKREQKGTVAEAHSADKVVELQVAANTLNGALQVYIDSPALGGLGPKDPIPTSNDGNPGAPPPPPYTEMAPSELNGVYDKVNQKLIFDLCVANIGGLLRPNAIAHVEVDAHSLKGTVEIWGNQTQAACEAKTGNSTGPVFHVVSAPVQLAQQGINQNSDKDKCTDMEELLRTGPATCGDDPYNPHDSDENFNSVGNLLVTVLDQFGAGGADWDKGAGTIIPGIYYHCITDTQHNKTDNTLLVKAYCYIDSTTPGICQINVEAYPGVCGDGIAGAGPPWPASKNPLPYQEAWGDIEDNTPTLTGIYDKADGHLHIEGCFADKDGFGAQGNVYASTTVNAGTGQGTVDLTILILDTADCQNGPPFSSGAPFPTAKLETVEQANKGGQGAGYDTDRDGCSDKEELNDQPVGVNQDPPQKFGGLRDPYKYWDFYDPDQNRQVALGDFLAVLSRFSASDLNNTTTINRYTDPLSVAPPPPAYHPRFDRGGSQQAGTVGLGWNDTPPDGTLALGDFLSLLRSFGHTCIPGPNDLKYPYAP